MWKRIAFTLICLIGNILKLTTYGNFNTSEMEIISIPYRKLYPQKERKRERKRVSARERKRDVMI